MRPMNYAKQKRSFTKFFGIIISRVCFLNGHIVDTRLIILSYTFISLFVEVFMSSLSFGRERRDPLQQGLPIW